MRNCPGFQASFDIVGARFGEEIMKKSLVWWDSDVFGVEHFGDTSLVLKFDLPYLLRMELTAAINPCYEYLKIALEKRYTNYHVNVSRSRCGIRLTRKKRLKEDFWNESPMPKRRKKL